MAGWVENGGSGRAASASSANSLSGSGIGDTRRLIINLLEAFFQRSWLFMAPLVLALIWGVATASDTPKEYRSVGTISAASSTLLGDLTQTPGGAGVTWETPASVTARSVNELLRTREFLRTVLAASGMEVSDVLEDQALVAINRSAAAYADGDNLVRIQATTNDPELARLLATATVESYRQWQIDQDVAESTQAETFFETQLVGLTAATDAARAELNQYLIDNPVDREEARPLLQQLEIARLQDELNEAVMAQRSAQTKLGEAGLATAQAREVVDQRFRLLDAPETPRYPEPRLRKAATTVVVYGVLGALIAVTLLVAVALMDRSVRIPEDIEANFGLDVLAVVPVVGR